MERIVLKRWPRQAGKQTILVTRIGSFTNTLKRPTRIAQRRLGKQQQIQSKRKHNTRHTMDELNGILQKTKDKSTQKEQDEVATSEQDTTNP